VKTLQNIFTDKKYLFLDRDGVINKRMMGGYITTWDEFEFLPGVLEGIAAFTKHFDRICIITNQQGIGKGLMTHHDLSLLHTKMKEAISSAGGKIDQIYYCAQLITEKPNCRKPDKAMAKQALLDFPEINFSKSIMIGDTIGDLKFAKNTGMTAVLLENEYSSKLEKSICDYSIHNLTELTNLLK